MYFYNGGFLQAMTMILKKGTRMGRLAGPGGTPDIMMNLTGHSLGGAYATILAWPRVSSFFEPHVISLWAGRLVDV